MDTIDVNTQSKRGWRKGGLVALGVAAVLVAAGGIAWATGAMPGPFGHGFCRAGMGRDFVEFRIHKALKQVNASDAQEQQIVAIVDGLFAEHQAMAGTHKQMHDRLLAAVTGATVDRAAVETVRAEAVTRLDQGSKDLAKALGDIAEVLTPAQRQQLATLAKEHMQQ
jgi:Spy/CpxP family protein refolding chaperone